MPKYWIPHPTQAGQPGDEESDAEQGQRGPLPSVRSPTAVREQSRRRHAGVSPPSRRDRNCSRASHCARPALAAEELGRNGGETPRPRAPAPAGLRPRRGQPASVATGLAGARASSADGCERAARAAGRDHHGRLGSRAWDRRWQADRVGSTDDDDLRRDVGAGRRDRLGQPRSGLPGHRRTGLHAGRGPGGHRRRASTSTRRAAASARCGEAIAEHCRRHYGLSYDPDTEVLVTTGATEALAAAILAFVDPGDEVIALEPFYDSYAASIDLAGGRTGRGRPVRPGLPARPGRAAPRRSPRGPRRSGDQLPAQPDRGGAGPGRAGRDRPAGHRPRRAGGLRRGVRAPGLRRRRAPAAGRLSRDARADDPDLLVRQDLLGHRLEDRLGARPGRS